MIKRNQLGVVLNQYQRNFKKVLCVCSAGCLRSPTAAHILSSPPWNFNTRAVGLDKEFAIIPITPALLVWADIVLVMDTDQQKCVNDMQMDIFNVMDEGMFDYEFKQVISLDIEDDYDYRNPVLVEVMNAKFRDIFGDKNEA
jgi:predicted protein tyrosine phosphatase